MLHFSPKSAHVQLEIILPKEFQELPRERLDTFILLAEIADALEHRILILSLSEGDKNVESISRTFGRHDALELRYENSDFVDQGNGCRGLLSWQGEWCGYVYFWNLEDFFEVRAVRCNAYFF